MRPSHAVKICAAAATAACLALPAAAADPEPDLDALDLKSAPVTPAVSEPTPLKLFVEGAWGAADRRFEPGSQALWRASADLFYSARLAPRWRAVVSNRFDAIDPAEPGSDHALNSLRELYVGWDSEDSGASVDLGRINWRQGPAYGYNPTDFFRDGALRAVTTANPFSLRENRLGVVMLRGQRSWQGGSVSLALAPKLEDAPSGGAWSADLGATNNRNRVLLVAGQQLSERVNGQLLLYRERGLDAQVGASVTALVSDAVVAHAEWSQGRERSLLDRALGRSADMCRGNRFSGGLTYTTASKLSLTAELHYNRFALSESQWNAASASGGPALLGSYLLFAQRQQDLASRRAYLLYLSQQSAGWKSLDLTAFVRADAGDHSQLWWAEARYHWQAVDVALQWQRFAGKTFSQYGLSLYRSSVQLVASYHFR